MVSKLLLTKNLKKEDNLVNGCTGIVKDIIYAKNKTPANNLNMYKFVDFGNIFTSKYVLKTIKTAIIAQLVECET